MFAKTWVLAGAALGLAPAAAAADWTGFYIGAEAGGGRGEAHFGPADGEVSVAQVSNIVVAGSGLVVVPGVLIENVGASADDTGFGGSVVAGFNYQAGGFVFGIEGDYSAGSIEATSVQTFTLPQTVLTAASDVVLTRRFRSDWSASLRLRAGYAFGDALIYATGGVAFSDGDVSATDSYAITPGPGAFTDIGPVYGYPSTTATVTQSKSLTGWSLGAGIDYALSDTMVLGLSYRHTEFDESFDTAMTTPMPAMANNAQGPSVTSGDDNLSLTDDRVSLRLTFKLG